MTAYLQRFDDTSAEKGEVPGQIQLTKPEIKIGWGQENDIVVPCTEKKDGHLAIQHDEDGSYYVETCNFPISLNGYPIAGRVFLQNHDCLRIGNLYQFRFVEAKTDNEYSEANKKTTPTKITHPLGARKCRIRINEANEQIEKEMGKVKGPDPLIEIQSLENVPVNPAKSVCNVTKRLKFPKLKRQNKPEFPPPGKTGDRVEAPVRRRRTLQLQDIATTPGDPGMTMILNVTPARVSKPRSFAELISPNNGQILPLNEKKRYIVGRMSTCDLCLIDEYISREQLELSRTSRGFLLKNIGKNEIIVEKKGFQAHRQQGCIVSEEKVLKPGETSFLTQEATVILGSHILYYFNVDTPHMRTSNLEMSILERKHKFYKHLAEQKQELLRAAQLQKILTPPRKIFKDLQVGVWFKYFAIGDLSGDFFLTRKKDDSLFLCLGDVSGHGPASALWAGQISGMFETLAADKEDSREIITCINHHLMRKKNPKHTLYALINLVKITPDSMELCIAGNSVPPLYYSARENKLISLDTPSTPVGMMGISHFKTYVDTIEFRKDDMLLMFTDGVTEAEMLDDGTQVEYQRAQEQIQFQIDRRDDAEEFLDTFLQWMDHKSEIQDDLSIVLITRL